MAALSGPVAPDRLRTGVGALEALGFEVVQARNLLSRHGLFAGSDDERLAAFHELAADPSLRAIVFARGGHGVLRLLPRIDWDLLAARPRAYVGYSDLTAFLAAVVSRLDLVAFHGPMAAADFARGLTAAEEASWLAALAGRPEPVASAGGWLRPGRASGVLAGGCLSLLTATLGTAWAPVLADSILFWEDVAEPSYRVDRMLTHLELSGNLAAIRGMVIGHSTAPATAPEAEGERLERLVEAVAAHGWPVAHGFPAGHQSPNLTLPLGMEARLAPDPVTGSPTLRFDP